MDWSHPEIALVLPNLTFPDTVCFLTYVFLVVYLPGRAICHLVGWRPAFRFERWALAGAIGVLWSSLLYFVLVYFDLFPLFLWLALLPVLFHAFSRWKILRPSKPRSTVMSEEGLALARPAHFAALAVIAFWVIFYVVRVQSLVVFDDTGVRLYGAMYSDKVTPMSLCATLQHEVPPRNLRMAGTLYPYHYFPHLFVASASRVTGVDYVDLYWYHATGLGIALSGLAVLAFARRMFRSDWVSILAICLYGLWRVSPETRPLDLAVPLLLLGLLAAQRSRCGMSWRWGILAVLCLGAMPAYEIFFAITAYLGLAAWWAFELAKKLLWDEAPDESAATSWFARVQNLLAGPAWQQFRFRTTMLLSVGMTAAIVLKLISAGSDGKDGPTFRPKGAYRSNFTYAIRGWAFDADDPWARTIYQWKRNRPAREGEPPPTYGQEVLAELAYNSVYLGYVFFKFVNVAVFGLLALWMKHKRREGRTLSQLVLWIGVAGLSAPFVLNWGHYIDGQWWGSPNVTRLPHCAAGLLLITGAGMLVHAVGHAWQVRYWLPLCVATVTLGGWIGQLAAPQVEYYHMSYDRLGTLAYLRSEVPYGEVVLHPWRDTWIHNDRRNEKGFNYKRHFIFGSSLAGQQMFYEGQQIYQCALGSAPVEQVSRRNHLHEAFYQSAEETAVEEVLTGGKVQWIVADEEHPPPAKVVSNWSPVFTTQSVTVYRRPSQQAPATTATKQWRLKR